MTLCRSAIAQQLTFAIHSAFPGNPHHIHICNDQTLLTSISLPILSTIPLGERLIASAPLELCNAIIPSEHWTRTDANVLLKTHTQPPQIIRTSLRPHELEKNRNFRISLFCILLFARRVFGKMAFASSTSSGSKTNALRRQQRAQHVRFAFQHLLHPPCPPHPDGCLRLRLRHRSNLMLLMPSISFLVLSLTRDVLCLDCS